jgi:hypothetical protein
MDDRGSRPAEWVREIGAGLEGFVKDAALPELALVRQTRVHPPADQPGLRAREEVRRVLAAPGQGRAAAVAVGSRGIANLAEIVTAVIAELKHAGWDPFIVPAMGSHGGASAAGQVAVLAGLGVTEHTAGAPIRATMDVRDVGTADGARVFLDRYVAEAGAVFLINRVKAHTDFRGPIESGPAKMLAIGLGHLAGAAELHAEGPAGLASGIPAAASLVVAQGYVLGALALVENEVGQTAIVRGLAAAEIGTETEARLLTEAKAIMPRLPFGDLDVLVVQDMGKDISGEGVDPNVIGRFCISGVPEPEHPQIRCIVALRLTPGSHGNALGVGLIDFAAAALAADVDFSAMYANALTAGLVDIRRAKLPIVLPTDRLAIQAALSTCGRRDLSDPRLMWIQDTEHLETVAVSPALAREAADREDLVIVERAVRMRFDPDGSLLSLAGE